MPMARATTAGASGTDAPLVWRGTGLGFTLMLSGCGAGGGGGGGGGGLGLGVGLGAAGGGGGLGLGEGVGEGPRTTLGSGSPLTDKRRGVVYALGASAGT